MVCFWEFCLMCQQHWWMKRNYKKPVELAHFTILMTKTGFQVFLCGVRMAVEHYRRYWQCSHISLFFHQQVSTGHIIIPSSLLWLQSKFLLMTAVGLLCPGSGPALSTFHWWTRTAICLNKLIPAVRLKPLENASLWQFQACLAFQMDFQSCSFL